MPVSLSLSHSARQRATSPSTPGDPGTRHSDGRCLNNTAIELKGRVGLRPLPRGALSFRVKNEGENGWMV